MSDKIWTAEELEPLQKREIVELFRSEQLPLPKSLKNHNAAELRRLFLQAQAAASVPAKPRDTADEDLPPEAIGDNPRFDQLVDECADGEGDAEEAGEEKGQWGGKREGQGRPAGTTQQVQAVRCLPEVANPTVSDIFAGLFWLGSKVLHCPDFAFDQDEKSDFGLGATRLLNRAGIEQRIPPGVSALVHDCGKCGTIIADKLKAAHETAVKREQEAKRKAEEAGRPQAA